MTEKRFCPECGSRDVEPNNNSTNFAGEGIANVQEWECNNCGYVGVMPQGSPEEAEF